MRRKIMRRFFLLSTILLMGFLQTMMLILVDPCAPSGGSGGEGGMGGTTGLFDSGMLGQNDQGLLLLIVLILILFGIFGLFFYQRSHQTADLAPRSFTPPSLCDSFPQILRYRIRYPAISYPRHTEEKRPGLVECI